MSESKKHHISLLFDTPPEECVSLVERLGEKSPILCESVEHIKENKKVILVQADKELVWDERVAGVIHPAHLSHPSLEYLLKRSSDGEFSVDLNESFEDFEKEVHAYKFIDPFEEGEISDVVSQKILNAGFDPLPFRTFHTALMGYLAHHVKRKNFSLPIEIQLGLFQGCVVVQTMVSSSNFTVEQIEESFKATDVNNLYLSFLRQAFESCHLMDITKVETGNKLLVTGIWCHDQYGLPGGTLLYQTINRLRPLVENLQKNNELQLIFQKRPSDFSQLRLSGQTARRYGPDEYIETDHPYIVKMIVDHCYDKIEQNKAKAPTELDGLVSLLADFKDRPLMSKLNSKDWESALKALQDTSTRELLAVSVDMVSGEVEDDLFERITGSLSRLSVEEASLIVGGGLEEVDSPQVVVDFGEEEDISKEKISGTTEHIKEARTMVRGSPESNEKEAVTVIKGSGIDPLAGKGVFNNKISNWEEKKKEVLFKTQVRYEELKSKGESTANIEIEMADLIKQEIGLDEETAAKLVRNIMGESRDEVASERVRQRSEMIKNDMHTQRLQQELSKRDQQIEKMKKLVVQAQTQANKKIDSVKRSVPKSIDDEFEDNKSITVEEVMPEISGDDIKKIEKQVELKEIKIKELESRVEFYKSKSGDSQGLLSELQRLKKENTTLKTNAELLASRSDNMSERMNKQKEEIDRRDKSALTKFRERFVELENQKQQAKDQLTKLDFANREMLKKIQLKDDEIIRLRQIERNDEGADNIHEAALKEAADKLEEARLRERTATQEAKSQSLKIRQLEQKLKFATAQSDKQASRASRASGAPAISSNEKRLDKINQKLAENIKTQNTEITERRKEVAKFKAENNQLQHKLNELERQLSKFDKAS